MSLLASLSRRAVLAFPLAVALAAAPSFAQPLADGELDPTFSPPDGIAFVAFDLDDLEYDRAYDLLALPDGRLLLAGLVSSDGPSDYWELGVARLTADGALDPSFGDAGRVRYGWDQSFHYSPERAVSSALQPDGKIVLATAYRWSATDTDLFVVRLLPNGEIDPSFGASQAGWSLVPFDLGPEGMRRDLAMGVLVAHDGGIVVVGTAERAATDWDMAIVRLTPGGLLDSSFSGGGKRVVPFDCRGFLGKDVATSVTELDDHDLVLAGECETDAAGGSDVAVARLSAAGEMRAWFGAGGKQVISLDLGGHNRDEAEAVTFDAGERLLIAGPAELPLGHTAAAVFCLDPWGDPCNDFGSVGASYVLFSFKISGELFDLVRDLAIDGLGRIVVAGRTSPSWVDVGVARLLPNGAFDPTFGIDGRVVIDLHYGVLFREKAEAAAFSAGRIVVAGAAEYEPPDFDFFAIRLHVSLVFADGFERGSVKSWSSSTG